MTFFADEEAIEADEPTANASAFLISPDGLAVTNYHSIDGAISGRATLITGEACAIKRVIYYDADIDLAVIRIAHDRRGRDRSALSRHRARGREGEVRMGDTVYALGNPLGLGLAMSRGIVSATAHKADLSTLPCIVSDATISRGSSGGARCSTNMAAPSPSRPERTFTATICTSVCRSIRCWRPTSPARA